ncbi:MAG: ribosomal protein S18-alanine N-acetyltransferase [Oscillospiraceae bacterium]|nr:ribosomal-protein-alanine N-acetyltransferase [Oscillospiraceae bacterium]MBQ2794665.1 ribosomal protein S18-alanine N-acetyltransferase [Oscillospiraceae bacterium]MBQ2861305.1 ribosomal protein S18-alanine N-acetyltransferase [Oscillospiraceae bacterium]MBQ2998559.1 ribosomal protein S18-alanine N-acetyltransferase [Oscillospiraceae bacterium]MBQ3237162.1 ribosomal protein S18-alanine N-acetyltransferase [Oscillospiraceae bacterium]
MNCKIIRLCEKDVCNMAKAEKSCFSHPWSENALLGEIKSSFSDFFGAFCEDEFAGYIGGRTVAGETEIFNVAVLPEFRRKGIGKALIEEFIKTAIEKETRVIFLEVRTSNLPAINLYEKCGFVFCGIRKDYYDDPKENAILMRLAFDGTQEYEEWEDEEE